MYTIETDRRGIFIHTLIVSLLLAIAACSYISSYDQYAYQQDISLKVDALALMDKATETYASHTKDVQTLQTELEKAYEYAKARPKNEVTTKQWELLMDPDHHLLGGFLKRWKAESKLSPIFIQQAKGLVGSAFDTISGLESGKVKASDMKSQ